ncbi:MAG: hypothetical protein AAFQ20_15680, partial [Bacteroidota bacterium]
YLAKEQKLCKLLDRLYETHLKTYTTKRISDPAEQLSGTDVLFQHKYSKKYYRIDEKAQLDYLGKDLPTFAFELCYYKTDAMKKGWLFDSLKKTDFYALITNITLKNQDYCSCCIRFVNRKKLVKWLEHLGLSEHSLNETAIAHKDFTGKVELKQLNMRHEGYLYCSGKRKAEKPVNLILYLDMLEHLGIAKRFI